MKSSVLGQKFFSCSFYLYRFRKYVSYGFPIINFCNPGIHYETPCISSGEQILSNRFLAIDAGAITTCSSIRNIRWYWHVFRSMSLKSFNMLAPRNQCITVIYIWSHKTALFEKNTNLQLCRKVKSLLQQYGFVTGFVNLSIANLIYRWDSLNSHVNIQNDRYWSAYISNTGVKLTEIIIHAVSEMSSQKLNSVFSSLWSMSQS